MKKIQVFDKDGKYDSKIYTVATDSDLLAGVAAIDQFISDHAHDVQQITRRDSLHFSRFAVQVVQ